MPSSDQQTIQNLNIFECDPGFGGLVTDSSGNPVQGVKVQIHGPDRKLLATSRGYSKENIHLYTAHYIQQAKTAT